MASTPSDLSSEDASEPKKPHRQILQEEISEGLHEFERPALQLFLSGVSAGLDIGFSVFLIATMQTLTAGKLAAPIEELLMSGVYTIGFFFVVLGRSELFTEHTTLAVLPVLHRRASLGALGRLWGTIYAANLVGAAAFAGVAVLTGPRLGVIDPGVFGQIARRVSDHSAVTILLSGILAGWLMGLLSWLVTASRDTISQIAIVGIIAAAIGFTHLHHSIVGSVKVLTGIFSAQGITLGDFGHFLLWATLGNAIGGAIFVALLKYSFVRGVPDLEGEQDDTYGKQE